MLSLKHKENLENQISLDNFWVLYFTLSELLCICYILNASYVILLAGHYILLSLPYNVTSMEKGSDAKWFGTLMLQSHYLASPTHRKKVKN